MRIPDRFVPYVPGGFHVVFRPGHFFIGLEVEQTAEFFTGGFRKWTLNLLPMVSICWYTGFSPGPATPPESLRSATEPSLGPGPGPSLNTPEEYAEYLRSVHDQMRGGPV